MRCVFKTEEYAPEHCFSCAPLHSIFSYSGLSRRDSKKATKNVLLSYSAIKADDIIRDSCIEKEIGLARFIRQIQSKHLPDNLNKYLKEVDKNIRTLEAADASIDDYINYIAETGGEIFTNAIASERKYNKKFIRDAGAAISSLMTLTDILMDRQADAITKSYNPWSPNFQGKHLKIKKQFAEIMARVNVPRGIAQDTRADTGGIDILNGPECLFYGCIACANINAGLIIYGAITGKDLLDWYHTPAVVNANANVGCAISWIAAAIIADVCCYMCLSDRC